MKCEKETMLLYAVTDRMWTGKQTLMEQVEDALKGGATCVQLREKELDEENFLKEAIEMKALCAKYGVPFIVNDNVEIAIKCKADGIHVGQSDMEAGNVRALVGEDMIIGVSTKKWSRHWRRRRQVRIIWALAQWSIRGQSWMRRRFLAKRRRKSQRRWISLWLPLAASIRKIFWS